MPLSSEALEFIQRNGFAVMDYPLNPAEEYISRVYGDLRHLEIPLFITVDSLLHFYQIQFDETLRSIEDGEFFDSICEISQTLFEGFVALYESSSGMVKEGARRNAAFFAIALYLLEPEPEQVCSGKPFECNNWETHFTGNEQAEFSFEVPLFVKDDVDDEPSLIYVHGGFSLSPV